MYKCLHNHQKRNVNMLQCTADIFVDLFKQKSSVRIPVSFEYVGKYCTMFGVIHINILLCSS